MIPAFIFVAHKNESIVGAVLCGNDGRYGNIRHLAVTDNKRNIGIGRLLVQACIDFLKKRHILIMVRENNKIGAEFWRKMSFQQSDWLKVHYIKTAA